MGLAGKKEGRVNYGREVGAARLTGSKTTLGRGEEGSGAQSAC